MLVDPSAAPLRGRRFTVSRAAQRELAAFAAAYLTYFGVRAITEGAPWRAFANAAAVFRFEVQVGIDWERSIQSAALRSRLLVEIANAVYMYGHWPVLILSGVLLFRYRRRDYYRLRNVCLLTGLVGLVIFTVFPVAPPRLTDLPLIDTVTRDSGGYRQILPRSLVNEFAAMPSFHAGWNLAVGVVVFRATRHWMLRAGAVVMPAAMALAVVVTANHFVIDVVVGVAIVLLGLAIVGRLEARRERRRLSRRDALGRGERQSRCEPAVRRSAPRRERHHASARRRRAEPSARRG